MRCGDSLGLAENLGMFFSAFGASEQSTGKQFEPLNSSTVFLSGDSVSIV